MAQNLARRMRPRNIDEIVGQKHLDMIQHLDII